MGERRFAMSDPRGAAVRKPTSSARDERGQILILTALSMPVLLAIAALSIDASYMYDRRNKLYAAADAAAKAGAIEVSRDPMISHASLVNFAHHQLGGHGFRPLA